MRRWDCEWPNCLSSGDSFNPLFIEEAFATLPNHAYHKEKNLCCFNPLFIEEAFATKEALRTARPPVDPFQSSFHRGSFCDQAKAEEEAPKESKGFNPLFIEEAFATLPLQGLKNTGKKTLISLTTIFAVPMSQKNCFTDFGFSTNIYSFIK